MVEPLTGTVVGAGVELARMAYQVWLETARREGLTEEQKTEMRIEENAKFYGKYHKDNLTPPP